MLKPKQVPNYLQGEVVHHTNYINEDGLSNYQKDKSNPMRMKAMKEEINSIEKITRGN